MTYCYFKKNTNTIFNNSCPWEYKVAKVGLVESWNIGPPSFVRVCYATCASHVVFDSVNRNSYHLKKMFGIHIIT